MEEILLEFAQEHGIKESEVLHRFLASKSKIETLEDLENLPEGMLNHIDYIVYCPEPLKSYIQNEMWINRYQTITLERVVDRIRDSMEYDDNDEPMGVEDSETNRKLQKVIDCMIECKFGSVVNDW